MKLFQPITIKGLTLKNRLVLPALHLNLGLKSRRAQAFYLERARGGVGTIITSGTPVDLLVDDAAWGKPGALAIYTEVMQEFIAGIHETGTRIGIQLWHGNQLPAGHGGFIPDAAQVAPSATDSCREMTIEEIRLVMERFAAAAATAKQAGFDFVELHGAHGYLLCQFFSPRDNQRWDDYGGDLGGRMQFGIELAQSVRQAVGEDYPVFYRLGALEYLPGGIALKESCQFARELEKAGIDVIDVSLGRAEKLGASPNARAEMGTFAPLAGKIRENIDIPVIAVGRINTGEVAESILADRKAELVAVGRQLIADPFWPQKVQEGREAEIVACESCNRCFGPIRSKKWRPGDRICKINDRAGRETE